MSKPVIISGEASETESEDEGIHNPPYASCYPSKVIKGDVIIGEDFESDNENDGSISSAISALNYDINYPEIETKKSESIDSLLHQKLREANGKLNQDIESFAQNMVSEACKNLTSIDQQLIKSQLTLQSAVTSLKSLSINSVAIKNKLQCLISAQFLPNIKICNK